MSLRTPVSNSSESFDPAPAGWAVARCYAVIDLGTHFDQKWDKETHLVRLGFELPNTKRDDGKPFAIFKRYTLSHHEKSRLRQDLEGWYGKKFDTGALNKAGGFDLTKLLGREAFINVTHADGDSGNVYANITALGPLPADMKCPAQVNQSVLFSLETFDSAVFETLSKKTKEQIMQSGEYKVMTGEITDPKTRGQPPVSFEDAMADDIPF